MLIYMFMYILADYPLNGNSQKFIIVYCSYQWRKGEYIKEYAICVKIMI